MTQDNHILSEIEERLRQEMRKLDSLEWSLSYLAECRHDKTR